MQLLPLRAVYHLRASMGKKLNFEMGQKFGNRTVLEHAGTDKHGGTLYRVQCICGTIDTVRAQMLKKGRANSCKLCVVKYANYHKLNLVGQKFGKRTVLEEVGKDKWGAYLYKTQCECGTIDILVGSSLKKGEANSCGCFLFTGDTFGKRTVLKFEGSDEKKNRLYLSECICGDKSIISATTLRSGRADSCQKCAVITHGLSYHPLNSLWKTMVARCHNPKQISYKHYGARGIQVHESWRQSPKDFIEYVESRLGPRPTKRHQLDRINNNGNYEPGNVRWATPQENCNNRRNSKI